MLVGAEKGSAMRWSGIAFVVGLMMVVSSCSGESHDLPVALEPCDEPVPVTGNQNPGALGYVVGLHEGADAEAESQRLSDECSFTVDHVNTSGPSFIAQLDVVALGCVRCDRQVVSVYGDMIIHPDNK